MTDIKVLDKSVFNRIAAGEVVDRPASIVKELVENAIDAGATAISITVKGGGIELVRVSDNGHGIKKEAVKTAFLPHATSKIKSIEDLEGISTLGFRGEALPSIASVAKVTMLTRTTDNDMGVRYVIDNGNEIDFGEMGAPFGTSVSVEDLFGRIPARRKFLSKENSEENAITNLMAKFILANSSISFNYTANGKSIYTSSGQGLESAILTVYGSDYLSKMIKIESTVSDIVLYGYINKPSFSKHTKSFQTLIVNGRYVENDEISYLIYGCYQKYLMKRQYPTYVLHLNVPHDLVDVNVHPNKMEVKFAIPQIIKKIISDTIRTQVMDAVTAPKEIETDDDVFSFNISKNEPKFPSTANDIPFDVNVSAPSPSQPSTELIKEEVSAKTTKNVDSSVLDIPSTKVIKSKVTLQNEGRVSSPSYASLPSFSDFFEPTAVRQDAKQITFDIINKPQKIGKLFNTYIIMECNDEVFLIDQHAAHEKILYDRLVAEYESGNVAIQPMLIPYDFDLSPIESEIIEDNLDVLSSVGFTVEKTSQGFSLKTIPYCCAGLNTRTFISDFLSANSGKLLPQVFKEKLMQSACKAAVKGEDDLSQSEIEKLLDDMSAETTELFCPHGRPIVVKLKRREIEKWFKRIV